MYPDFLDEPGPQGRDSPQDVLIAPGILMRLVPGSPAVSYLGTRRRTLKLIRRLLEHFRQSLECRGEVGFGRTVAVGCRWARGQLVTLAGQCLDLIV